MPSQSLSRPSQLSGAGVHWQISPEAPKAPQLHPGRQLSVDTQVVVQTSPASAASGKQVPASPQSELREQGAPTSPVRCWQIPVSQASPELHADDAQQACPAPPQEPLPLSAGSGLPGGRGSTAQAIQRSGPMAAIHGRRDDGTDGSAALYWQATGVVEAEPLDEEQEQLACE